MSSEVECIIQSLHVIASVDTLDLYALVGPMDCFDYRHISRIQGTPMEVASDTGDQFFFKVDTSAIPREGVWQVQLKLSSTGQNITTIHITEMTVTVDRVAGSTQVRKKWKDRRRIEYHPFINVVIVALSSSYTVISRRLFAYCSSIHFPHRLLVTAQRPGPSECPP